MTARQTHWLVAPVVGGLLSCIVGLTSAADSLPAVPLAAPRAPGHEAERIAPPRFAYVGAGSCAADACHGAALDSPVPWRSAYSVWATQDRHANAYAVLYSSRSKEILRQFDAKSDGKPWTDQRCLACHATTSSSPSANREFVSDGVSCESCHGAAGGWLVAHTTAPWKAQGESRFTDRFGMRDVHSIANRGAVCVDCHVGRHDPSGVDARVVNHDLIAAGHPRLLFELSAYLARMPVHWDVEARRKPGEANDEARAWVVGQRVTAEASHKLQAAHAATHVIEFAEYDCYACHHELRGESWRQSTKGLAGRGKPGAMRISTWSTALDQPLDELGAPLAAVDAERWASTLDARQLRRAMSAIAARGAACTTWDDATQCYLALVALDNASKTALAAERQAIRPLLDAIYVDLQFRKACVDERGTVSYHAKCPGGMKVMSKLDSPNQFEPARVQSVMVEIARKLSDQHD